MTAPAGASPAPVLSRAQARVLWAVMAAALGAAVALSATLRAPRPPPRELGPVLPGVVALVAVADAVMAYALTASIRRRAGSARGPFPDLTKAFAVEAAPGMQILIACALSFGAGLFACVGHFLTRDPLFLAIVALPAAVLVHWFPSQSRWARITPPAPATPGAPQRSGLVRE